MAYSLLKHNTFGIDATCSRFVEYTTVDELVNTLTELIKSGERWMHIGGGSNLLFLCDHYDGTILHSKIMGIEVSDEDDDEVLLRVGAGENWDGFVEHCVNHGWYGLENLSYIPGEVGASAVQNVGAYGVEAGDMIETVEGYLIGSQNDNDERTTLSPSVIDHADCEYGYRTSVFKRELKGRFIVTHVWYRLKKKFEPVMTHTAVVRLLESQGVNPQHCTSQEVRNAVVEVRRAKLPDPKEIGSAGSFFMNPVVSEEKAYELIKDYPAIPHYPAVDGVKIPAGWLIEQCGWKGKSEGAAGVHPHQALVLINRGGAKGSDIEHLAFGIQADVRRKFGIELHPEVMFIQ